MGRQFAITMAVLMMVIGSASGVTAEEGVTETEIHIGTFGPLTGPAAMWGASAFGIELFFKLVNEQGGIHGRKVVVHIVDDSYNPAKTKHGVKQLQENTGIFAWVGGIGSEPCLAVMDYLVDSGIPWIAQGAGLDILSRPPKRTIFTMYPSYHHEATILSRFALENLGLTKIAMVYQDDTFGNSGLKGVQEELAGRGLELAAAIPVPKSGGGDLLKVAHLLRHAQAEAVLIWISPISAMQLMQKSKYIGYRPQWIGPVSFADFPATYKLSNGLIEGLIVETSADPHSPMIAEFQKEHHRIGRPAVEWSMYYLGGIAYGQIAAEGMKRCGPDLTRDKFIQAMETLDGFETISNPVTYGKFDPNDPKCRSGIREVLIMQCREGGEPAVLTDPIPLPFD